MFKIVNDQLRLRKTENRVGATALIAIIKGETAILANLGDCRAVVSKTSGVERLTNDHKPLNLEERRRIKQNGGKSDFSSTSSFFY